MSSAIDELLDMLEDPGLSSEMRANIRARIRRLSEEGEGQKPEIDFPVGPTGGGRSLARRADDSIVHPAHERGVQMYGIESPAEARERWIAQEQRDPEGVYGLGGATAGGIFGGGAIPMADYDPAAHNRTGAAASQQVQIEQLKLMQEMRAELQHERAERKRLESQQHRQITGGGGRRELPEGRPIRNKKGRKR